MIISPGRGYIFVHIPKTGGTSMALALEARAQRDDILIGDTPKAVKRRGRLKGLTAKGRLWKHATLADIDGILTPTEIGEMLCFCLVRNPWDRMVSYYHWLRVQSFDHPAVKLAKALEFDAFLAHDFTRATLQAWPYGRYMQDATGRQVDALYLRLEHLAQDMAAELFEEGVYVSGFFYPVVPRGQARIRTQMNAALTKNDLEPALGAFERAGKAVGALK